MNVGPNEICGLGILLLVCFLILRRMVHAELDYRDWLSRTQALPETVVAKLRKMT